MMRHRLVLSTLVAGALMVAALGMLPASAAAAQSLAVANTCSTPTTGTNTAPNKPCFVTGLYSGDYTGTNDTNYYTQAGGHPFVGVTDFTVATGSDGVPSGNVSKIRVDLPKGLISNPQAVPQCIQSNPANCPASSQLGVVELNVSVAPAVSEAIGASVYNMVPPPGKVADYAFEIPVLGSRIDVIGGLRSGSEQFVGVPSMSADDGLYFTINVPSLPAQLVRATLIFWGVPGDSAHAPDVGWSCLSALSLTACTPPASGTTHTLSGTPFLTLPSGCMPAGQVGALTLTDTSGDIAQVSDQTPVPATGCSSAGFAPTVTLRPQTTEADSPTGVSVDVHVPQNENPSQLATSTLDTATVTLPPGMTLDPSAANGLRACSAARFALGSDTAPSCLAASQVGTAQINTPLLPGPLTGAVYLGCNGASAQTPCTPASPGGGVTASLYVYVTAPGRGLVQKLVGTVTTSAATGQLTATFANLPEVPFSDFVLNLNGGATAPLANPLACGTATTSSSLTPYSGTPAASPSTSFTVDANGAGGACSRSAPFAPGFSVSPHTLQAGAADTPLTVDITRADRQQPLGRITVALPPGLLGVIASVPECPATQAAGGGCPATSRIGSTTVLAGSGNDPISQSGTVYLTGPYHGAPFGLSVVVPAVAGPFNLGVVVVRAAINLDRNDAHVTFTSDPLPQVVGGVPLRIRGVTVTIDRPGFILNPSSCASMAVTATLGSAAGASATGTSPFNPTGCGALAFSPGFRLAFSGKDQTTVGHHPAVTATLTSSPGQASVRSATVTLPRSIALDPNNSEHVCAVAASATDSCPANTAVGSATVSTPLLGAPLTGTVYLVQGIRTNAQGQQIKTLPALLIPLRGQVALDLHGQTSVNSTGRLVTTFATVPDAPISSFVLKINGGKKGILVVTGHTNLCPGRQTSLAAFGAQSGSDRSATVPISVPCAKPAAVKAVKVAAHTVRVSIQLPSAGRLKLGGPGLVTVGRKTTKPRLVTLTLRLSRSGRAILSRKGKLSSRVAVSYTPRTWPTQTTMTRKITIRR